MYLNWMVQPNNASPSRNPISIATCSIHASRQDIFSIQPTPPPKSGHASHTRQPSPQPYKNPPKHAPLSPSNHIHCIFIFQSCALTPSTAKPPLPLIARACTSLCPQPRTPVSPTRRLLRLRHRPCASRPTCLYGSSSTPSSSRPSAPPLPRLSVLSIPPLRKLFNLCPRRRCRRHHQSSSSRQLQAQVSLSTTLPDPMHAGSCMDAPPRSSSSPRWRPGTSSPRGG